MEFSEIIGHQHIKSHLLKTIENGRIPHAQLFIGINGSGLLPMAIAYASELICKTYPKDSSKYKLCQSKIAKLEHPDLHFVYPVNTSDIASKNAISDNYATAWREFILENPYASLFEWLQHIGIEKKQGIISKYEAENISKKLSLKSFEGGYKVMIIWMADNMNSECSNKILKLVEEPTEKTVLIFITEKEEKIITTIKSRCQKLNFPPLSEASIVDELVEKREIQENIAVNTARRARGDFNKALQLLDEANEDNIFEEWFITWVRTAFRAKGNKSAINSLIDWSESIASQGRETQKKFISFCLELFREALLKNYQADSILYFEPNDDSFSLDKFAPFVHQNNIFEITEALENAFYHIERNGNAKMIFTDLSIQLTRLIHRKETA